MSKELEALKKIGSCEIGYINNDKLIKHMFDTVEYGLLLKALTPPTADEVCKVLSEYYGLMVRYDDRNDVFQKYVGDGDWIVINIVGLRTEAPHLITLIGRFYQSLEEELK